jgi:hypothetical protein
MVASFSPLSPTPDTQVCVNILFVIWFKTKLIKNCRSQPHLSTASRQAESRAVCCLSGLTLERRASGALPGIVIVQYHPYLKKEFSAHPAAPSSGFLPIEILSIGVHQYLRKKFSVCPLSSVHHDFNHGRSTRSTRSTTSPPQELERCAHPVLVSNKGSSQRGSSQMGSSH